MSTIGDTMITLTVESLSDAETMQHHLKHPYTIQLNPQEYKGTFMSLHEALIWCEKMEQEVER